MGMYFLLFISAEQMPCVAVLRGQLVWDKILKRSSERRKPSTLPAPPSGTPYLKIRRRRLAEYTDHRPSVVIKEILIPSHAAEPPILCLVIARASFTGRTQALALPP